MDFWIAPAVESVRYVANHLRIHIGDVRYAQLVEEAWFGDAQYRVDTIKVLQASGFKRSYMLPIGNYLCSAKFHSFLVQVYRDCDEYCSTKGHMMSSVFEAMYIRDDKLKLFTSKTLTILLDNEYIITELMENTEKVYQQYRRRIRDEVPVENYY